MIGMQFSYLQGKGVLDVAGFGSVSTSVSKWKNEPISVLDTRSPSPSTSTSTLSSSLGGGSATAAGNGGCGSTDNISNLAAVSDNKSSLPQESGTAAVVVAPAGGDRKDEWGSELQPIPTGQKVDGGERYGLELEDWDSLLSESGQDQSLFRWIASEVDDGTFSLKQLLQGTYPVEIDGYGFGPTSGSTGKEITSSNTSNFSSGLGNWKAASASGGFAETNLNPQIPILGSCVNNILPGEVMYQQQQVETPDKNPHIFYPQVSQNSNMFRPPFYAHQEDPLRLLQPHPKRQNLGVSAHNSQIPRQPFSDSGHEFFLRKQQQRSLPLCLAQQMQTLPPPQHLQQKPMLPPPKQEVVYDDHHHPHPHQQQVLYDQLYKAAELILAGNFQHAQGILARLNHQLPSPISKPFQTVTFYFKEALQSPLMPLKAPTPFDGLFKMDAYKLLSEISPLIQFMNFTSNQALLESLDGAESVHVVDFDIGFGAQWASFMQELPRRNNEGSTVSLKITAFATPSTHHPLELGIVHEILTQFAEESGIIFELEVVNLDVFDPNSDSVPIVRSSEKEAIVVNLPIWACSSRLYVLPSVLRFIKQLSPKIMVSMERGCERADLPFPLHLLHSLQYFEGLLDSINAANANSEIMDKIEKFIFQPRIQSIVLGRLHSPDPMPHWKALFASVGFSPVSFSNFAETQAECVLKRSQVRGFDVEKRQASLVLCWQQRELISASAWRC